MIPDPSSFESLCSHSRLVRLKDSCIRVLQKGLGHEEVWKPMQVFLTEDRFCFGHERSARLIDSIHLLDIKNIEIGAFEVFVLPSSGGW